MVRGVDSEMQATYIKKGWDPEEEKVYEQEYREDWGPFAKLDALVERDAYKLSEREVFDEAVILDRMRKGTRKNPFIGARGKALAKPEHRRLYFLAKWKHQYELLFAAHCDDRRWEISDRERDERELRDLPPLVSPSRSPVPTKKKRVPVADLRDDLRERVRAEEGRDPDVRKAKIASAKAALRAKVAEQDDPDAEQDDSDRTEGYEGYFERHGPDTSHGAVEEPEREEVIYETDEEPEEEKVDETDRDEPPPHEDLMPAEDDVNLVFRALVVCLAVFRDRGFDLGEAAGFFLYYGVREWMIEACREEDWGVAFAAAKEEAKNEVKEEGSVKYARLIANLLVGLKPQIDELWVRGPEMEPIRGIVQLLCDEESARDGEDHRPKPKKDKDSRKLPADIKTKPEKRKVYYNTNPTGTHRWARICARRARFWTHKLAEYKKTHPDVEFRDGQVITPQIWDAGGEGEWMRKTMGMAADRNSQYQYFTRKERKIRSGEIEDSDADADDAKHDADEPSTVRVRKRGHTESKKPDIDMTAPMPDPDQATLLRTELAASAERVRMAAAEKTRRKAIAASSKLSGSDERAQAIATEKEKRGAISAAALAGQDNDYTKPNYAIAKCVFPKNLFPPGAQRLSLPLNVQFLNDYTERFLASDTPQFFGLLPPQIYGFFRKDREYKVPAKNYILQAAIATLSHFCANIATLIPNEEVAAAALTALMPDIQAFVSLYLISRLGTEAPNIFPREARDMYEAHSEFFKPTKFLKDFLRGVHDGGREPAEIYKHFAPERVRKVWGDVKRVLGAWPSFGRMLGLIGAWIFTLVRQRHLGAEQKMEGSVANYTHRMLTVFAELGGSIDGLNRSLGPIFRDSDHLKPLLQAVESFHLHLRKD